MADKPTSGSYFQSLRYVHAGQLLALIVLLALVRFVFLNDATIDAASVNDIFILYTPGVVMLLGILIGEMLFQKRVKSARNAPSLSAKLTQFRAASIIRWAALVGPSLFAIVWFMIYADKFFMAIALVGMALLAFARPSVEKTGRNLRLDDAEQRKIEEPGF